MRDTSDDCVSYTGSAGVSYTGSAGVGVAGLLLNVIDGDLSEIHQWGWCTWGW
jgi:hypothetical protein